MINIRFQLLIAIFVSILLNTCSEKQQLPADSPSEITILQQWDGDYPADSLEALPDYGRDLPVGYLTDAAMFARIWKIFKPDVNVPEVDFADNIVVYYRNITYYNRTSIFKLNLQQGILEILARETLSAMPIDDKVAVSLVVIPAKDIHFIKTGEQKIPVKYD